MTLKKKKKKVIHDLNNLAQQVVFHGNEEKFYTCSKVKDMLSKYGIYSNGYLRTLKRTCEKRGIIFRWYIKASDEELKEVRLEAMKKYAEEIKNGEHDHLFI